MEGESEERRKSNCGEEIETKKINEIERKSKEIVESWKAKIKCRARK